MDKELSVLSEQLQGHWKLDNGEQQFEINGKELTVFTVAGPVKTSFTLVKNLQLGNWQIKVMKPISWLRTFIVNITPDTFTLYDFDLAVQVRMGGRSRLLNPTRIYKYTRVGVAKEIAPLNGVMLDD